MRIQQKTILAILFLTVLFFCTSGLSGQPINLRFNHLSSENGLSQGTNAYIYQDSRGFIWLSSNAGVNRYDGREVTVYKLRSDTAATAVDDRVISGFFEDSRGNIWFTSMGGLHYYDRKKDRIENHPLRDEVSGDPLAGDFFVFHLEGGERLWLRASTSAGSFLYHFDLNTRQYRKVHPMEGQRFKVIEDDSGKVVRVMVTLFTGQGGLEIFTYGEGGPVREVFLRGGGRYGQRAMTWKSLPEEGGLVWLAADEGLGLFDPRKDSCRIFDEYEGKPIGTVWSIEQHPGQDLLFVSTRGSGLLVFDKEKQVFIRQFRQIIGDPGSLRSDMLNDLYIDRHKNLWVSIWGRGVDFANLGKVKFSTFFYDRSVIGGETQVNSIVEGPEGKVWIGTEKKGIFVMDPESKKVLRTYSAVSGGLPERRITRIVRDDVFGLLVLSGRKLYRYRIGVGDFELLAEADSANLNDICRAGERLLLASYRGVWELTKESGGYRLKRCPEMAAERDMFIYSLFLDQGGRLYLSRNTTDIRIYHFDEPTGMFRPGEIIPGTGLALKFLEVEASRMLWVATSVGLTELDFGESRASPSVRNFDAERGLPQESFHSLIPGGEGQYWLGSRRGLLRFRPADSTHHRYTVADGLQGMEFTRSAAYRSPGGELWIGGINGLNVFSPEAVEPVDLQPAVVLTRLLVNNEEYTDSVQLNERKQITLRHDENNLTFYFAALDYSDPGANRYRYRLVNYDANRIDLSTSTFAHLSKLPPGDYTFEVEATNSDGVWNEAHPAAIQIKIKHHPLWTPFARGAYAMGLLLVGIGTVRLYRDRLREKEEARRLQEMDELKSRFFTNITHEFRTPLTMILGPVSRALRRGRDLNRDELDVVRRQGRRLLNLINQILDLNKLEAGRLSVRYIQSDIIRYLRYLYLSFDLAARHKELHYLWESDSETFFMDFDPDKLNHIFLNLISNAIKFTESGGTVKFRVRTRPDGPVDIFVEDTGVGIPSEKLERIFDRFYQVDSSLTREKEGTGIGLALSKELTELLNGSIEVESTPGKGTRFTVSLPVNREAEWMENAVPDAEALDHAQGDIGGQTGTALLSAADFNRGVPDEAPEVLIVEDNEEVANYIASCLRGLYRIYFAENGESGVDQAVELIPDIIISDVMMPRKSGLQLTDELKNDKRTSHVPIILLTAKTDDEVRLAGVKRGADAHLAKPFLEEELRLRIQQLLSQRERLQNYFQRRAGIASDMEMGIEVIESENAFFGEASQIVERECHRVDFTVEELAAGLYLSPATLNRKFNALVGMSPKKFISRIRLKRAKDQLIGTDLPIGQIALNCGYNENAAFTKAFKKAVKTTPKEYREAHSLSHQSE